MRHSISIATMILVGTMLTGCGGGSDSDAGTPVVGGDDSGSSGDAGSAISVSVGASDYITDGETTETYSQEFTVQVVDSVVALLETLRAQDVLPYTHAEVRAMCAAFVDGEGLEPLFARHLAGDAAASMGNAGALR